MNTIELVDSGLKKLSKDDDLENLARETNDQWIKNIVADLESNTSDLESFLKHVCFEETRQPIAEEIHASDLMKWISEGYENPGSGFIHDHLNEALLTALETHQD